MSKFALPIAELKPALAGLGKLISKRVTLPVLSHVKIERTKDGWVALTATDLDHHITLRLEQPSQGEACSLLVPFDELQKTVKACAKGEEIIIERNGKNTVGINYTIGSQVVKTEVETLPVEEFPEIPRIKGEPVTVNETLRQAIHDALECASSDETRLILNGCYVDVSDPKSHHVVGTDGHHLFSGNSFALPLKNSVIIPSHKFLGWREFNHDGEWQLKVQEASGANDPSFLQLSSRRWRFITRQIDGNYPNWRQVIINPRETTTSLTIEPPALEAVIQTIQRMPCHDAINRTIGLELVDGQLSLLGKSPGADVWTKVEIQNQKNSGSNGTIFLNREFLSKALGFGLNHIEIIDAISPLRISEGGRQMIIMPVRAEGPKPASPAAQTTAEENGKGAAEPVTSTTPNERSNMAQPATSTNGNGSNGEHTHKPTLEAAVEQVEAVKASLKSAREGLNQLLDTLKQVQREQKSTDKEVQSVRSTLEKLQSVRI